MASDTISEYLVRLGFETDQQQLLKFKNSLVAAEGFVANSTGGIVADFLKFETAGIGAFTAVGFGAIGFIEKLAMTDQQMRLFGMRSFMTTQQARAVQTSLDVLGASLDDVAWDKELHARFMTLIDDQRQLSTMLGPQYEQQMMDVRDVWFQLQRLEVKGEYFGMKFAGDLLKKLGFGDGDILNSLMKLNDFVLKNMPQWSDELSTDFLPVLHDFWDIMKGIGGLAEDAALEFTNLVGIFAGDDSIEGATFDFHKFSQALGIVAHFLAVIVEDMLKVERIAVRFAPIIGGAAAGAAGGALIGGVGAVPGAIIGGLAGAGVMGVEGAKRANAEDGGSAGGNIADQARQLAKRVSASTGIPADLIFAQWAHETGGFTNRGTTQLNNLAGIRYAGSTEYRKFDSPEDFADFYGKLIESKRYTSKGINEAKTPEAFAHALKAGSYYEGPEDVYARQMRAWEPKFAGSSGSSGPAQISVGSIPITITNPGATREEIQVAVTTGVRDGLGQQTQTNMTNVAGIYQ